MNNNEIDSSSNIEPFKVVIRIRPFLQKELNNQAQLNYSIKNNKTIPNNYQIDYNKSIFTIPNSSMLLLQDHRIGGKVTKEFIFDKIFDENNNNYYIFENCIKDMIDNLIKGYNSTVLAYGITSSGKTHTIFGELNKKNIEGEKGIIFNSVNYLFHILKNNNNINNKNNNCQINSYTLKASYLEIYNETVIDLLNKSSSQQKSNLMIVEDPIKGIYVPDLLEYSINSAESLLALINDGNTRRTMAPTNQNVFSSRSHAILQINLEQHNIEENKIYTSKFLIVDLAGSERGGIEKGKRREEGANINKSLLSLGNCINILSDKSKIGSFVPYRDSKLTRILKDSLGGNIKTLMLACVSPSQLYYDETLNTLNYATRAKKITKKIVKNVKNIVNEDETDYKEIIDALKEEIETLKKIIKDQEILLKEKDALNNVNNNVNYINYNNDDKNEINNFINNNNDVLFNNDDIKDINLNENKNNSFLSEEISDISNKSDEKKNNNLANISVDLDKYQNYLEKNKNISLNKDINQLESQIKELKNDKMIIENQILIKKSQTIINKYNIIKSYYDKYIELINDKLIENIEECMILKCNLKEINQLNLNNESNLKVLNNQLENVDLETTSMNRDYIKLIEDVDNIQKAVDENNKIKIEIHTNFTKSLQTKKILKNILLSLLNSNNENGNKYLNILKEREELKESKKNYEKQIKNMLKEKNKKDEEINKANKELEILKRKLIEKDNTINHLKKLTINQNNNEININKNNNLTKINNNNNEKNNNDIINNGNNNGFYISKNNKAIIEKSKSEILQNIINNCNNKFNNNKNDEDKKNNINFDSSKNMNLSSKNNNISIIQQPSPINKNKNISSSNSTTFNNNSNFNSNNNNNTNNIITTTNYSTSPNNTNTNHDKLKNKGIKIIPKLPINTTILNKNMNKDNINKLNIHKKSKSILNIKTSSLKIFINNKQKNNNNNNYKNKKKNKENNNKTLETYLDINNDINNSNSNTNIFNNIILKNENNKINSNNNKINNESNIIKKKTSSKKKNNKDKNVNNKSTIESNVISKIIPLKDNTFKNNNNNNSLTNDNNNKDIKNIKRPFDISLINNEYDLLMNNQERKEEENFNNNFIYETSDITYNKKYKDTIKSSTISITEKKKLNSLRQARYENKIKNEKDKIGLDNVTDFINKYEEFKNNINNNSNNNSNNNIIVYSKSNKNDNNLNVIKEENNTNKINVDYKNNTFYNSTDKTKK